ncbi:MAG: hypothetical protein IPM47_20935 [Sphingobacteriales bacterium]|nr:MAG: hypothetical protein IPM47_20935 [Sphingobacteriales bacterium]
MKTILSVHWALIASLWYFGNGILHSGEVLMQHKGNYDRELLRLLMDGHVLMLSGAVVFMCWLMMLSKIQCGGVISIIVACFMLLYCAMIFPFLKSYATMAISIMLIIASIKAIYSFPNIYNIMQNYK